VSEFDKAMRNIEGPWGDGSRKSGRLKEPAEDEAPAGRARLQAEAELSPPTAKCRCSA
jgi:hypothetical protein